MRVNCEDCLAYEKFRRHPSEGTGECRMRPPVGVMEPLGADSRTYRAKWPIVFRDEWCMYGELRKLEDAERSLPGNDAA